MLELSTLHLCFPPEVYPIDSSIINSNLESVFQVSKLLCVDRLCSSLAALKTASSNYGQQLSSNFLSQVQFSLLQLSCILTMPSAS